MIHRIYKTAICRFVDLFVYHNSRTINTTSKNNSINRVYVHKEDVKFYYRNYLNSTLCGNRKKTLQFHFK